jgi:hypothetical protein
VDLGGLWGYVQRPVPDDNAALAAGHVDEKGDPALHGTFTRIHYFVLRVEDDKPGDGAWLIVYDEDANFSRFLRTDTGTTRPTWVSQPAALTFTFAGNPHAVPPLPATTRTIYPTLELDKYASTDCPSNRNPGDLYVKSAGDASTDQSLPTQTLTYHTDDDRFYWSTATENPGLLFQRVSAQAPAPDSLAKFGETFTGQTEFAQLSLPYFGFDPRKMEIYSAAGSFTTPGTWLLSSGYPATNPGQVFASPLVFNFPADESHDYVRDPQFVHAPNLPIGRSGILIGTMTSQEQSEVITTLADRMNSWSVTLGLSAGVKKMLSASAETTFGTKVESQQKQESRYVVSRSVDIVWANLIHVPSLTLKDELVNRIKDLTHDHLSGSTSLDWPSFVDDFGTHYCHTVTQGKLQFAETRFSLKSEVSAVTQKLDVKSSAQGIFDGLKGSGNAAVASEWSTKLGTTIEQQDVDSVSIGTDDQNGIAILYDLRPMTELFSPLLVPYNPADDWQQLAPWVWSEIRESFATYLEGLGLNQPLEVSCYDDYTPRLVKLTFPQLCVSVDDRRWMGGTDRDFFYVTGSITFDELEGAAVSPADGQFPLSSVNFSPDAVQVDGQGRGLADSELSCILALRAGQQPHVKLKFDLLLFDGDERDQAPGNAFAHWVGSEALDMTMDAKVKTAAIAPIEVQESKGLDIYYYLHFKVQWEDLGPIGSQPASASAVALPAAPTLL